MLKKQVLENFKNLYNGTLKNELKKDRIAVCEHWNNYTDMLMKNGDITEYQYSSWNNPFQK